MTHKEITAGEVCHFLDTDAPILNEALRRIVVAELHKWPLVEMCISRFIIWIEQLPSQIEEELFSIEVAIYNIGQQSIEETGKQYSIDDLRKRIWAIIGQLDELYPDAGIYEGWQYNEQMMRERQQCRAWDSPRGAPWEAG